MSQPANPTLEIGKRQLSSLITFAIKNVPEADEFTLKTFLELVNTTGSFGSVTPEQLKEAMCLMMKLIPQTCSHSLLILVELLKLHRPHQVETLADLTPLFEIDADAA